MTAAHHKPCAGYQTRTAAVMALVDEGIGRPEISRRLGIPLKNVSALIVSAQRTKANTRPGRLPLGKTTIEALLPSAEARCITVNELVVRLVERAAQDNLVDAILDDRETDHG